MFCHILLYYNLFKQVCLTEENRNRMENPGQAEMTFTRRIIAPRRRSQQDVRVCVILPRS